MTRYQAHAKAHALWGTHGITSADRVGCVLIRRKNVVDRFEVGYHVRDGGPWTVMGKGASWEEAFARASRAERSP